MQPSAAYDAAQAQPIGNWAARPRPNQGLGTALLVLGALVVLSDIFRAATAPAAVHAYEAAAAEGRDPAQVITAYGAAALLSFLLLLSTWIVGSLWLSRARENAVLIAPDRVRRSAVWAWLGWCGTDRLTVVPEADRRRQLADHLEFCRSRPARPLPRHHPVVGALDCVLGGAQPGRELVDPEENHGH